MTKKEKYSYCVLCYLSSEDEIKRFCVKHNISPCTDKTYTTFIGSKEDLELLHDKFFEEYEFNIQKV
jgi:hypothetical protein